MNRTIYSLFTLNRVYPPFEKLYISTTRNERCVYNNVAAAASQVQPLIHAQRLKKVPLGRLGQVDFLAGQVTSHPPTKSLTKMSKKWPCMSKMWELRAQRTSWNSTFFWALMLLELQWKQSAGLPVLEKGWCFYNPKSYMTATAG